MDIIYYFDGSCSVSSGIMTNPWIENSAPVHILGHAEYIPYTPGGRAKCPYCGQWADRQSACPHCGGSVD
jgi:uncharacterized Zn-finger protein